MEALRSLRAAVLNHLSRRGTAVAYHVAVGEITVRRATAKANVIHYEVRREGDLHPLGWVYRLDRSTWIGLRWDQTFSPRFRTRNAVVAWLT